MPFPTTGVLDNFNRGNAESLGTSWTVEWWFTGTEQTQDILSSQAADDDQFSVGGDYYNVATYGPDGEVHCTINAIDDADGSAYLLGLRITTPGNSTTDAYRIVLTNMASDHTVQIQRGDNTVWTQLGASITSDTFVVGDGLGLEAKTAGSTIKAYRRSSGTWSEIGSRTDATYEGAGYVGLGMYREGSVRLLVDDFGGGTVVAGGVTYNKTGGAQSSVTARGIDANLFTETGASRSPATGRGIDANIFGEAGSVQTPTAASGTDSNIFDETGAGLAPGVATSTDSVIFEEIGSASAPAVASGERVISQTYTKTGGASSPVAASGADENLFSETGGASSPDVAAGADANVFGETGSASATAQASSADQTLYNETGGSQSPAVASGLRSGAEFDKTGGVASPVSASGPDSNIFGEAGGAASPVSIAGVDSVVYVETGTAESPAVASGARIPAGGGSTTWIPIGSIPEIDYTFEPETSTHEIRRKRILKDDEEVAEILALLM